MPPFKKVPSVKKAQLRRIVPALARVKRKSLRYPWRIAPYRSHFSRGYPAAASPLRAVVRPGQCEEKEPQVSLEDCSLPVALLQGILRSCFTPQGRCPPWPG